MLLPACEVLGMCLNASANKVAYLQTRLLMEKAHAISEKWESAPVAIAGDFNSTPNVISLFIFIFLMIHQELAICLSFFLSVVGRLRNQWHHMFMLPSNLLRKDAIY